MCKSFILSCTILFNFCFLSLDHLLAQTNCVAPDGTILVSNTNDAGPGSLREAIHCANNNGGSNTIVFDIPGTGDQVIFVGATSGLELPALLATGTVIDGTSQPSYGQGGDFTPKIILDGGQNTWTNAINAVWVRASYCELYGLEIRNFPDDGIDVNQADFCIIGAPNKGNIIYANGAVQDEFPDATPGPWEGCGIVLRNGASNCTIQGNIIGTDESLAPNLSNEYCGIINRTASHNTIIGGNLAGEANVIAYQAVGIRVDNSFSCQFIQNSFFCNDSVPIQLVNNGNLNPQEPLVNFVSATSISGLAANAALIEVYATGTNSCANAPCQGKVYLGTTTAVGGTWVLNAPFANAYSLTDGESVTALSRDANGNSSDFAICNTLGNTASCTDDFGVIWVNNTADEGLGSLRAAIDCANNTLGANTIKFNLNGTGTDTIKVGQTTGLPLPAIVDAGTTIDGTTHPDFGNGGNFQPRIILDGQFHNWTAPIDAIWVQADFCSIYALEIINFPDDGIDFTAANYGTIGGVKKGNVLLNNGWDQDYFPDFPNTGPWNGCAIVLRNGSSNCKVLGNIIGTNYSESSSLGNEYCGVIVQHGGDGNVIGGNNLGEANIIANNQVGINISANAQACSFLKNKMYCNSLDPIRLQVNANNYPQTPVINTLEFDLVAGQATAGDQVDVYLVEDTNCMDAPCQGSKYLGTTVANSTGNWTLNGAFANNLYLASNDVVTAIATGPDGSSSDFAVCNSLTIGCGITVSLSHFSNASCGLNNGSVTFNIMGGSGFYSYDLGNGNGQSANPVITNLAAGSYTITIVDIINNCSILYGLLIEDTGFPSVQVDSLQHTSCGLDNGYLALSVNFGATPYTYDIGNGPTTNPIFSALAAGTYDITVSDANACTGTASLNIAGSTAPLLQIDAQTNASCNLGNGSISISASGGTPPYSYDIGDGPTDATVFSSLTEGDYVVVLTDAAACTSSSTVTISNSGIPQISISNQADETCHQGNGAFSVTVTDGLAPFGYDIGNGSVDNGDFNNLTAGNYSLTVTDATNCSASQNIIIENNGEFPIADFTYGTTVLNLNVSNNASLATSYLWDFGDGHTSTEFNPSHDYAWSGYYMLCLTATNDCGTDQICKGIIVADPNEDLLRFEIPPLDGAEGELLLLPVVVDKFQDMSAFQFSINLTDHTVAKFLGVNNLNLTGLDDNDFVITDQTITCNWSDNDPNGHTLADQTAIFWIALELIGNGGDCTSLIFGDQPLLRNAFRQINGLSIKVPSVEINGTSCILEPLASVNIFGKVEKENGVAIPNAMVNGSGLNPDFTLSDGTYAFNDLPLGDYTIFPFNDNNPSAGVSVLDVFMIQQHILHINYLDSPYKIISADVDDNGNISVLDLFELQRIILNLLDDFTNNTSWRFIPKSHVFANPQFPLINGFPEEVVLSDLSADTSGIDFIAMKIGDMTLNASLSNRPPILEDKYFLTEDKVLEAGTEITVAFNMKELDEIAAYQFELNFDTDHLSFVNARSNTLENNAHQFGDRYLAEGVLSGLWIHDFNRAVDVNTPAFELVFKVLKDGKLSEHLRMSDYHLEKRAYEEDGKAWGLKLQFQTRTIADTNLNFGQTFPNPFKDKTDILFSVKKESNIQFELFDVNGRLIFLEEKYYPAGSHRLSMNAKDFPASGIYFYRLRDEKTSITQKIIHQK